MDSQHERQQSRLDARSEAYSRQGRPAKGLSASRDRSLHLHPGGLAKDRQVQHPIEPRTQTGHGRQGHQFFRTVRKILPAKRWRKWKKNKEAINLSVRLAEKPEVKRQGYAGAYGADKAEPVTGYPAGPYLPPLCPSQVGYPPHQGYQPYAPPHQGYQPYPPRHSEIYNGPPHQGYQPYPPRNSEIYNGPPHQGYQPYPPRNSEIYNGPPHQGYQPYPPPYPSYHPYPPNPGYRPNPPPYPSYHPYPPNTGYQPFQGIASSVLDEGIRYFIKNGLTTMGTLFSDGNNDDSYENGLGMLFSDGSYDGGSSS